MTISPVVLWGEVQLAAIATVLGSACPANTKQVIKRVVFTNMDVANRTITVYVARNGTSVTNANCIINQQVLSAGQAYVSPEMANLVLSAGDNILALCDVANKVNTVGSGFQQ